MSAALSSRACVQRPSLAAVSRRAARSRGLRVNALAVPDEYGYVMTSVALAGMLTQWQAIRVAAARRKYGVSYPTMYAEGDSEEAVIFNCTQRAHQNTLEYLPATLGTQMMLGLVYPKVAAGLGLVWAASRVVYTLGYSTGDPSKRLPGTAGSGLAYVALLLSTVVVGLRTALHF
ncbi:hypothetical protein ABPG75_005084 [Micractinium tetrahymenae]